MAKSFQGNDFQSTCFSQNELLLLFSNSVALSMLWGNLYYVYMARKLAYKENRGDVCTMPYGINTPGACKRIAFSLERKTTNLVVFAYF